MTDIDLTTRAAARSRGWLPPIMVAVVLITVAMVGVGIGRSTTNGGHQVEFSGKVARVNPRQTGVVIELDGGGQLHGGLWSEQPVTVGQHVTGTWVEADYHGETTGLAVIHAP